MEDVGQWPTALLDELDVAIFGVSCQEETPDRADGLLFRLAQGPALNIVAALSLPGCLS